MDKAETTTGVEALLVRNEELQSRIKLLESLVGQLNTQVELWKQKAETWEDRAMGLLNIK